MFTRVELERMLDWYRALPACRDVVSRDDELGDKIALELVRSRIPFQAAVPTARLDSSEPPGPRADQQDDVEQLREALRAAERAHRAYLAELRQGDVEPVERWSTWYAEYLLGLR